MAGASANERMPVKGSSDSKKPICTLSSPRLLRNSTKTEPKKVNCR